MINREQGMASRSTNPLLIQLQDSVMDLEKPDTFFQCLGTLILEISRENFSDKLCYFKTHFKKIQKYKKNENKTYQLNS